MGGGDAPLAWSCRCGTLRGPLEPDAVRRGTHLVCHCRDCRAALRHLGEEAPDGVPVPHSTPDRIAIDAGADRLAALSLSERGPLRWHAACCGAPLFNTARRPGPPFAGVVVRSLRSPGALGPPRAHIFVAREGGRSRSRGHVAVAVRVALRMLRARLSGRWRRTPFFDAAGLPVAAPRSPTTAESEAACGP